MRLVVLITEASLARLRAAVSRTDSITATSGPAELQLTLLRRHADVIVVDPELIPKEVISQLLFAFSTRPTLLYTPLTRTSAQAIAQYAGIPLVGIVLAGYDDNLIPLRNSLRKIPRKHLGARMTNNLANQLDRLPNQLRIAAISAYCAAQPVRSAEDLVNRSGYVRWSVDRWCDRVGLHSAKWVVSTANLIRAYSEVRENKRSSTDAAFLGGFSSLKALKHNAILLVGIPFRNLVAEVEPDDFLAKIR